MGEYATGHVPSPADRVQPRDPERLRVGFLTGSGHTGSTLLALFMDTHPQIVSVGETAIKPGLRSGSEQLHRCSCGHPISECRFWQTVFETGRSPQGVQVLAKPLNLVEMIK